MDREKRVAGMGILKFGLLLKPILGICNFVDAVCSESTSLLHQRSYNAVLEEKRKRSNADMF
jgi:hypothetical protein